MLATLMNDLLDLAQLESSSFKLRSEFYNLFDVIDNVADIMTVLSNQKKVKLITPSVD
jgi:signal transduction histidine kinase